MQDSRGDLVQDFLIYLLQQNQTESDRFTKQIEKLACWLYKKPAAKFSFAEIHAQAMEIDPAFGGWPMLRWRYWDGWRKQGRWQMENVTGLNELKEEQATKIEASWYSDSDGDSTHGTHKT